MTYFTGTTEELKKPRLLLDHGVPCWLVTEVFGHKDMSWFRQLERSDRNSLVGTTSLSNLVNGAVVVVCVDDAPRRGDVFDRGAA